MGRIKLEDAISNLELNIRWIEDIPAHQFAGYGNVVMAMRDALELLKEQQKKIKSLEQTIEDVCCGQEYWEGTIMDKLDKVIKGFEKCLDPKSNCYHNEIGCPYENQCWLSDSLPARPLKEEALELLKEYKQLRLWAWHAVKEQDVKLE